VGGRLVIYWQISFAKFIQLTIAMEVDIIKSIEIVTVLSNGRYSVLLDI